MSALTSIVLAPLSALYGAVTQARLGLYRRGMLNVRRLSAPVISVGNITTGGTGKTPLVEFVARALARKGHKGCVLTRGYGRGNGGRRVLVSDGERVLANESEAGDEPCLLAEKLLGIAAVISDADRFAAGEWAIKNLRSEVFLLDDGFQHLRLARNLNIVAIDATRPWGQGHLLPWGHLREPVRGLSRADCVVITRAEQLDGVSALREEIGRLVPNKPLFTSRMMIRSIKPLEAKFAKDHGRLPEKIGETLQPVGAFCGIGNPLSFMTQLKNAGYDPVSTTIFPDHCKYNEGDITSIIRKAKAAGANCLVTTAKDAVKLHEFSFEL
ncbi:MAG TPA: tetraacyldisaccharide 4'-kinase, partial [Pyrinomonadaceae bacterium]|nr:tetraacyldisaccharide 4'-kinase [Pyrinomonadaceae bacterium]